MDMFGSYHEDQTPYGGRDDDDDGSSSPSTGWSDASSIEECTVVSGTSTTSSSCTVATIDTIVPSASLIVGVNKEEDDDGADDADVDDADVAQTRTEQKGKTSANGVESSDNDEGIVDAVAVAVANATVVVAPPPDDGSPFRHHSTRFRSCIAELRNKQQKQDRRDTESTASSASTDAGAPCPNSKAPTDINDHLALFRTRLAKFEKQYENNMEEAMAKHAESFRSCLVELDQENKKNVSAVVVGYDDDGKTKEEHKKENLTAPAMTPEHIQDQIAQFQTTIIQLQQEYQEKVGQLMEDHSDRYRACMDELRGKHAEQTHLEHFHTCMAEIINGAGTNVGRTSIRCCPRMAKLRRRDDGTLKEYKDRFSDCISEFLRQQSKRNDEQVKGGPIFSFRDCMMEIQKGGNKTLLKHSSKVPEAASITTEEQASLDSVQEEKKEEALPPPMLPPHHLGEIFARIEALEKNAESQEEEISELRLCKLELDGENRALKEQVVDLQESLHVILTEISELHKDSSAMSQRVASVSEKHEQLAETGSTSLKKLEQQLENQKDKQDRQGRAAIEDLNRIKALQRGAKAQTDKLSALSLSQDMDREVWSVTNAKLGKALEDIADLKKGGPCPSSIQRAEVISEEAIADGDDDDMEVGLALLQALEDRIDEQETATKRLTTLVSDLEGSGTLARNVPHEHGRQMEPAPPAAARTDRRIKTLEKKVKEQDRIIAQLRSNNNSSSSSSSSNNNSDTQSASCAVLAKRVEGLERTTKKQEEDVTKLSSKLLELTQPLLSSTLADIASLKEQTTALGKKLDTLENDQSQRSSTVQQEHEKALADIKSVVDRLDNWAEVQDGLNALATGKLATAVADIATLKRDAESFEFDLDEVQQQLEDIANEDEDPGARVQALQDEIQENQRSVVKLTSKLGELWNVKDIHNLYFWKGTDSTFVSGLGNQQLHTSVLACPAMKVGKVYKWSLLVEHDKPESPIHMGVVSNVHDMTPSCTDNNNQDGGPLPLGKQPGGWAYTSTGRAMHDGELKKKNLPQYGKGSRVQFELDLRPGKDNTLKALVRGRTRKVLFTDMLEVLEGYDEETAGFHPAVCLKSPGRVQLLEFTVKET